MTRSVFLLFVMFHSNISFSQIINIPDQNFKKALIDQGIDSNGNGEIDKKEVDEREYLDVSRSFISTMEGIEAFENLKELKCWENQITNLDLSKLSKLEKLFCQSNKIESLHISNLVEMTDLNCYGNEIVSLNVNNNKKLRKILCGENQFTYLRIADLPELKTMECIGCQLESIELFDLPKLEVLKLTYTLFTEIDVSQFTELRQFACANGNLVTVDLSNLAKLEIVNLLTNKLEEITFGNNPMLTKIRSSFNNLRHLDISTLINLKELQTYNNQLETIVFSYPNHHLNHLDIYNNSFKSLDLSDLSALKALSSKNCQLESIILPTADSLLFLDLSNNLFEKLDLSRAKGLKQILVNDNKLTQLSLPFASPFLDNIDVSSNPIRNLDLSNCKNLKNINCNFTELEQLNLKNSDFYSIYLYETPNIKYVCADEEDLPQINSETYKYPDCQLSSDCEFVDGFLQILKTSSYLIDSEENCSDEKRLFNLLKFEIEQDTIISYDYLNEDKNGYILLKKGVQTIRPVLDNDEYFTITPTEIIIDLPQDLDVLDAQFCVEPIGRMNDMEISLIPVDPPIAGFESKYELVARNVGNTILSGEIKLVYQQDYMELIELIPAANSVENNTLSWQFDNLLIGQSDTINCTFELNRPTDNPSLNAGDFIEFNAIVDILALEATSENNNFVLKQEVLNSYDPNDKTCLEGQNISPELIGDYVHYIIRFENLGTANARNVIVSDVIDSQVFDISDMEIISTSHPCETSVRGNEITFVFDDIELSFDDDENDGYVCFRIKTWDNLSVEGELNNSADIYFDYNYPILTNEEKSIFKDLENDTLPSTETLDSMLVEVFFNDFFKENIWISSNETIEAVEVFDLKGSLIYRKPIEVNSPHIIINLPSFGGMYISRIVTSKRRISKKIFVPE